MKILIGMMHPKHVHMFKNFIIEMEKKNHEIMVVTINKDITEYLLKQFGLPYISIGTNPPSIYRKALCVPRWDFLTLQLARRFKPDIYIGQALPNLAHVSAIFKKPYIICEDTEHAHLVQSVSFPFAHKILTPSCYKENLGDKQVRFNSFLELGYLHPNYFKPNPEILEELGTTRRDKLIIIRFVSWTAAHDVGQKSGFSREIKQKLIHKMEDYGQVLINSESPLDKDLEKYKIKISPEKMHDLLYYANLLIGDSGTMTSEAGILGTPAIYCSSLVGKKDLGYLLELEHKYGLIFNYNSSDYSLDKAMELIQRPNLKSEWFMKKERLLSDKIDFTKYFINFVERLVHD